MRKLLASSAIIGYALLPAVAMAATSIPVPVEGKSIKLSDIEVFIEDIVDTLITISAFVIVGAFVFGGLAYMGALGDERQKKAGTYLKNAAIGAVIVFGVGLILTTIADFAQDPTQIVR